MGEGRKILHVEVKRDGLACCLWGKLWGGVGRVLSLREAISAGGIDSPRTDLILWGPPKELQERARTPLCLEPGTPYILRPGRGKPGELLRVYRVIRNPPLEQHESVSGFRHLLR